MLLGLILGVLLIAILVVALRTDLPQDEEDCELLEDEVLLYYDEEDEGLLDEEE